MKFSTHMFLDNRTNPMEFQVYRSKVKVTEPDYRIFQHCEIGQKTLQDTVTRELLHSA